MLVARTAWSNRIAFDPAGLVVSAFAIDDATLDGQPLPAGGPWLVVTLNPTTSSLVEAHRIGSGSTYLQMFGFTISPANELVAAGSVGTDTGTVDFGNGPDTLVTGGYIVHVPR